MKKFYALALAAMMAAPAFAAVPVVKAVKASDAQLTTLAPMSASVAKKAQKAQNAPAKVVSTIDDICRVYNVTYYWPFQSEDPYGGILYPLVVKGEGANEIIVKNFPYSDTEVVGTVDMSAKTVTFVKQVLQFIPNAGTNLVFQPERWNDDGQSTQKVNSIVAQIGDNGALIFNERDLWLYAAEDGTGYFSGFYGMEWAPLDYFTFNEAEWTRIGDSQFTDNVFNNFYKEEYQVGTVEVPTYKSNTEDGLYALYNPYMVGAWEQLNPQGELGKGPGFIVFNVKEPECVVMVPLTAAGLWINEGEETAPIWEDCFPWNEEGRKLYIEGYTYEDIIEEYEAVEAPMSSYNSATRQVELMNIYFGISSSPLNYYGFVESYKPDGTPDTWKQLTYSIKLGSEDGVNEIGVDANAPVKYFNLQGMEIANPTKGQLVIKTQGNKAQKFIVK